MLAYELFHLAETGSDFYGEGMDLFDEGGGRSGSKRRRPPPNGGRARSDDGRRPAEALLAHLPSTPLVLAGLMEGMSIVREPLLLEPQEWPPRPESCDVDEVWALLQACMSADPAARPSFADVASKAGEARQRAGGAFADWL